MPEDYGITTTTETQDKLIGGSHEPIQIPVTLASGSGALSRGHVLGRVTASGKYAPYDADLVDGTEVARAILARDADATSEDVPTTAYVHGEFAKAGLSWADQANDEGPGILDLLDRGIFVKESF